jgi:hypothetical protein
VLRTGIPTGNLASPAQHQDRVVLDPLDEPPILLFAALERPLRKLASGAVALDAPSCGAGDQQTEDGSEDQSGFGLARAPFSLHIALLQQLLLFILHIVNERLKLIRDSLAWAGSNHVRCRSQSLSAAQIDGYLRVLIPLRGQRFEGRKPALLFGIIYRQTADPCRVLLHA